MSKSSPKPVRSEDEPTIFRMKNEAVRREGRQAEFEVYVKEYSQKYPEKGTMAVKNMAFDAMGLDSQTAIQRHRDWVSLCKERVADETDRRLSEEEQLKQDADEFEQVFLCLPTEATREEVIAWIENHPAMILNREPGEDGMIRLTSKDISEAPSRSAASQLQHWVNRKEEFYR